MHDIHNVDLASYIGVIYTCLFFYSVGIVVYYAEPGFPWHTYITLMTGYYCSFGILLLVPIDIAACVITRRQASQEGYDTYQDNIKMLSDAYHFFFTMILILGSVILSYEEYYNTDGYFTILGKLAHAFYRMIVDLAAMLVAGIIVLGVLLGQKIISGSNALLLSAVVVTNGVYEFVLMFFLAYGMIEYPRSLWNKSDLNYSLLQAQMKATQDYQEISDHKISIQEQIAKVKYFRDQIGTGSSDERLKYAIQVLESDCPNDFKSERKAKQEEVKAYLTRAGQVTVAGLAKLRGDLNLSKDKYKMAQAKVLTTEQNAYILEDLVDALKNGRIFWSLKNKEGTQQEYMWYIVYKPWMYRIAAIACMILSILSFLGVVCSMEGVPNATSVYFLATHADDVTGAGVAVFILFTLGYTVFITFWALFQVRVPGFVELVPFRTSPENLSFNTRMCLRLAAPLAFFYLGWIAENGMKSGGWTEYSTIVYKNTTTFVDNTNGSISYIDNNNITHIGDYISTYGPVIENISMLSAFSRFYNLQAIPIVKQLYGTGFPVILFILLPLFAINFFNRLFVMCKMHSFQFGTAIPNDEQLREGKKQLAKFKKIAARAEQRSVLRGFLSAVSAGGGEQEKGGLFSFLGRRGSASGIVNDAPPEPEPLKEPEALSGMVEKKENTSRMMGSTWKPLYAEVVKPGILYFFKDKKAAQSAFMTIKNNLNSEDMETILDQATIDKIDLKCIINFSIPEGGGGKKDDSNLQLHIQLSREMVKLRFKTPDEALHWKSMLQEWKDYAVDSIESQINDGYAASISSQTGILAPSMQSDNISPPTSPKQSSTKANTKNNNSKSSAAGGGGDVKRTNIEQNLYDLDSIVVEDDPELMKPSGRQSSFFSRIGFGMKSSDLKNSTDQGGGGHGVGNDKPEIIEGWLDKKGKGKMSSEWQKKYCTIDEETSSLVYSKNKDNPDKGNSIDLRQVVNITMNPKSGGKDDYGRFDIDIGERVYKFRAKTKNEAENWVSILNEWREYFLLNI